MSEELLDVFKWVSIVVVAGLGYETLGSFISGSTVFSNLSCYIAMYTAIALVLTLLFSFIRLQIGGKIVGSDVFGRTEYYLGMCAGGVRYACIILVALAFLNARYYRPEDVRAEIKYQEDLYGSAYFPKLCTVQYQVFVQSMTGRLARDYLPMLLIRSTAPEEKGLGEAGIARAHERNVYDVLEKR